MEDLQSLLEKINREGIEKADAESKRIVDEARAKADRILKEATDEADKIRSTAEKDAAAFAERASETIRQASRDIVLGTHDAVTALLERLLSKDIDKALSDETAATSLVLAAVRELTGPGEITCGAKLAQTLKAQLSALGAFTVVTDEAMGTGFNVKLDGGRIEHTYTGEVIAAELARHLRPDLAKMLG